MGMARHIESAEFQRLFRLHLNWLLSRGGGGARGDFCHVKLDGMNLHGYTLDDAMFVGASLRRVELRRARLQRANFAGADLRGAFLHDANLVCADLSGADLRDAELVRADLSAANLIGARLAGARFLGARLKDTLFDNLDLSDALDLASDRLAEASIGPGTITPSALTRRIGERAN